MRQTIRFIRKGHMVELDQMAPTTTLLDYLREVEKATGTKEGCGEGDCGACTVAVGRMRDGRLVYEPVNSCIQMLGQVDGCEVVTVEDLAEDDGTLHPVQEAMVTHHASQCGFCTPGFVMSLFCASHEGTTGDDAIAGNLCRCTGYAPIRAAAAQLPVPDASERFAQALATPRAPPGGAALGAFFSPASLEAALALKATHPYAAWIAGGTDLGVELGRTDPTQSLLRWLQRHGSHGTKEGCGDGDCGACTVAIVETDAQVGALPLPRRERGRG
jgi:xanthine dehydrogenase small subunit